MTADTFLPHCCAHGAAPVPWAAAPEPLPRSTASSSKQQPPTPARSGAPTPSRRWTPQPVPSLGACFHNSLRPDGPIGQAAQHRYADELSDMAMAYLLAPDRFRAG